jgi:hypothetical protein
MSYRDPDAESDEEYGAEASSDDTYIDGTQKPHRSKSQKTRKHASAANGKLARSRSNKETPPRSKSSRDALARGPGTGAATAKSARKQNPSATTDQTKNAPPKPELTPQQTQSANPRSGLEFSLSNLEQLAAEGLQRHPALHRSADYASTSGAGAATAAATATAAASAAAAVAQALKPAFTYPREGPLPRTEAEHHASLTTHIAQQGLQSLIPASHPRPREISKAAASNAGTVCRSLHLSHYATPDLTKLSLYDVVVFCDDSTSMHRENRYSTLKTIVRRIARIGSAYNPSGITIRFINANNDGGFNGIVTEEQVETCLDAVQLGRGTPLGTTLFEKVVQPLIVQKAKRGELRRPVVVSVVTDGEPTGEHPDTLKRTILATKNELSKLSTPSGGNYGASGSPLMSRTARALLIFRSGGLPDCACRHLELRETLREKSRK